MHKAKLQRNARCASAAHAGRPSRTAGRLMARLLSFAATFILAIPAVFAEGNPSVPPEPVATVSQPSAKMPSALPAGASGIVIHIDPQTGAILQKPAPGSVPLRLTPQLLNTLSTSHDGLVEVSSGVPGGGVKVDLRGRFQSALIATIDAKGQLRMQHLDGLQPSRDRP